MSDETQGAADEDEGAEVGGGWHWTTAVPDAKPDWGPLRKALRAIQPKRLFRWEAAHQLPDGTRVDEFVHERSTALLFLGADGRAWDYSGMGPGAIGPSVLLVPGAKDQVARVLGQTTCDRCLHEVRRECWKAGEPMPWDHNARHRPRDDWS